MKILIKVYAAAMLLTLIASSGAAAIEMGDPNVSRDAAICRDLTNDFKKTLAARANDPGLDDAKKTASAAPISAALSAIAKASRGCRMR